MVGIDIVVISRVENLYKKFGKKFLDKFLTKKEQKYIKSTSTIAGFWAVKEASAKAIGTGIGKKCSFFDIKIRKNKKGAPKIKYSKKLRKRYNIKRSFVSISHDGGFAIGVVSTVN